MCYGKVTKSFTAHWLRLIHALGIIENKLGTNLQQNYTGYLKCVKKLNGIQCTHENHLYEQGSVNTSLP